MNKERKEAGSLLIVLLVLLVALKIAFYKESFLVLIRTSLSLFWVFVLPGFVLMYYWSDKLEFLERVFIGVALSSSIIGILSYYLGLIGLNLKYHSIVLPLAILVVAVALNIKKKA